MPVKSTQSGKKCVILRNRTRILLEKGLQELAGVTRPAAKAAGYDSAKPGLRQADVQPPAWEALRRRSPRLQPPGNVAFKHEFMSSLSKNLLLCGSSRRKAKCRLQRLLISIRDAFA